jgi:hypothetical protein
VLGSISEVFTPRERAAAAAAAGLARRRRRGRSAGYFAPDGGRILAAQHGRVRDEMNKHSPLRSSGSLLERAAEIYDFGAALRARRAPAPSPVAAPVARPARAGAGAAPAGRAPRPLRSGAAAAPGAAPRPKGVAGTVDRRRSPRRLHPSRCAGDRLAEEFRIIKRQLLLGVGAARPASDEKRRSILVCSAQPDEGKTFCAVNLALSLAGEKRRRGAARRRRLPQARNPLDPRPRGRGRPVDALADPGSIPNRW